MIKSTEVSDLNHSARGPPMTVLPGAQNHRFEYSLHTFFNDSVLNPFQDYFNSYETGQSVGGAKAGEPRQKHLAHQLRTWLGQNVWL